jgi:hypothetical protein
MDVCQQFLPASRHQTEAQPLCSLSNPMDHGCFGLARVWTWQVKSALQAAYDQAAQLRAQVKELEDLCAAQQVRWVAGTSPG